MRKLLILCYLLLIQIQSVYPWNVGDLNEAFTKLQQAIDFTNRNYKVFTTDLNCSLKQIAGQLNVLRRRIQAGDLSASREHYNSILSLRYYAELVASKAAPYTLESQAAKSNDTESLYTSTEQITGDFWNKIYHPSRDVDVDQLDTVKLYGPMLKIMTCQTDIFGNGENLGKCNITTGCWDYLTARGLRGYDATHQMFHMLMGEAYGCFPDRTDRLRYEISEHVCSNILLENYQEYIYTVKPRFYMDTFWERIGFCGMMGFQQFAREDWLRAGMIHRRPAGCWNSRHITQYNQTTAEVVDIPSSDMEDGCESHPTAVAMITLSQYIRYMLEEFHGKQYLSGQL